LRRCWPRAGCSGSLTKHLAISGRGGIAAEVALGMAPRQRELPGDPVGWWRSVAKAERRDE